MKNSVVVCLGHTDKLTVVAFGTHDSPVIQFVHGGSDSKAVSQVQLCSSLAALGPLRFCHPPTSIKEDLHIAVDDDRPRVKLLSIRHHNRPYVKQKFNDEILE